MKTTSLIILLSITFTLSANAQTRQEASQLFHRLTELQKKGVMYGHQDDLMYGHAWWYEKGRSDIKEITGDYPAVVGFELGEIETGKDRSLDSVSFVQITEQAKVFHQRNGIITVSWHAVNPITSRYEGAKTANGRGSAWDVRELSSNGLNAVKSILPGGENHAMFNHWLDILSDYFPLGFISPLAIEKGKLCALSECGNISEDLINIMKKYPLSYFLTWRNTYYENPVKRRPVSDDYIRELKAMYGNPHTLFLKDIQ
jgi:hypothetical protein